MAAETSERKSHLYDCYAIGRISLFLQVILFTTIIKNNKKNMENKKSLRKEEGGETKQRDKIFNKKIYRLQKYSKKYKSTYIN